MGKRELLLIVGFLIAGVVVYQATAPPAGPNERTLSFSRFIEAARREIRGNPASAVVSTNRSVALDADVTEVRVIDRLSELEIVGEDREDVEASLRVNSNAYDEPEAKRYAEETVLKPDRAGPSLIFRVEHVMGRNTGRQRAALALKVPSRLRIRIESRPGKLSIANVAEVEVTNSGGEAVVKRVPGRVAIMHWGGPITIEDVGTLKFNGRGTEATIKGVSSEASLAMEHGGELRASGLAGPVEVESRNADVMLENLEATQGVIRIDATHGHVRLKGVKSETRIDGRDVEIEIAMAGSAPVTIYSEGERVSLTPPPGGFRLDAIVMGGSIGPEALVAGLGLQIAADAATKETRATGEARGGGPTITIRTRRGDLTLRPRDGDKPTD